MQDLGRTVDEDRADHEQQHDAEDEHQPPGTVAHVLADDFRTAGAVMAHREHADEIVVDGPREDAPEDNPEVGRGAELGTHDGSEDGARAGNVEKLDHEDLP